MVLGWFNARAAEQVGTSLADQFAPKAASGPSARGNTGAGATDARKALAELLRRADREMGTLQLNFYKKAKFANSFKWRLLENGVERQLADHVTQALLLHLSGGMNAAASPDSPASPAARPAAANVRTLLSQANAQLARGAHEEAITSYQALLDTNPRHAEALNNLGAALFARGRYAEAEASFRSAIAARADYADAHSNLGSVLRSRGNFVKAEHSLRRAIKLKPAHADARTNLGLTLALLGRLREAQSQLEKALRAGPRNANALFGLAFIAKLEGRFEEANATFERVLAIDPNMPGALAGLAGIRKATAAEGDWLQRAEAVAASSIPPIDEAELRFAIGKYCDDVQDFKRAFQSYRRANELMKTLADPYERDAHKRFVDDMIGAYTPATIARIGEGASASAKPVFVVGMARSGTSLVEQIIASHPDARGAGELQFWSAAAHEHDAEVRRGLLGESTRKTLAEAYLRTLAATSAEAQRIVDKAPFNSDFLGIIHSVFPKARVIHMQRDPIDTCLSCYFQNFSVAVNFTMDLADLAHYYREHRRLIAHWHATLPPGTILDVPYEGLVADQEGWTRKILDFIGLEWNEQCLQFHTTKRAVATESFWQVRQKIYKGSVARWRNYESFIGPLRDLAQLGP